MREKCIKAVVRNCKDVEGLDELKRCLAVAMEMVADKVDWTEGDWDYMMTEILYRLAKREK